MLLQVLIELTKIPQVNEAWVTVAIAAISAAYSIYQGIKSDQALKEIEKEEKAKYEVTPEVKRGQQRAEALAKTGYSPEETAAFEQQIAGESELAYRRGTDIAGGELAPAIGAGIQAQKMTAIGKFAASGAQLKRQNIRYADIINQQIQQQENIATQESLADRLRREQAWGAVGQAGQTGLVEAGALAVTGLEGEGTDKQYSYDTGNGGMMNPQAMQGYGNQWYTPATLNY